MKPRWKRILLVTALGVAVLLGAAGYRDGRCGRRVAAERMTNHAQDFDFAAPPCAPASDPGPADLRIAYLGVGGLLIEWRGATLVSAPYYTRQGPFEALLGRLRVDTEAIARETARFDPRTWDTILSGHSHYDHLADVPELMTNHATEAELWTNTSGSNMLQAYPALDGRIHVIGDGPVAWIQPTGRDGLPLPYRFAPLPSDHAPHLYGYRYAHGRVRDRWPTWEDRTVRSMRDGLTSAFLIDLLDATGETAFRIHFQDSAGPGARSLPRAWIDERPVDLAVLCVPPYWHVAGYPEAVLDATAASYVLAIHYEDFLQPLERPLRFIRSLTDARLDGFLERVVAATESRAAPAAASPLCGPAGERWAMPLPGEWVGFEVPDAAVLTSSNR